MKSPALPKAIAAWGDPLPDWVRALAEACDVFGMRKIAEKIGVSPASLSLAINKRRGDPSFVKARVEAVIMVTIVACPVLGVMGIVDCRKEQARPFSSANPLRVKLYRACRSGCVHFRGQPDNPVEQNIPKTNSVPPGQTKKHPRRKKR